MYAEVAWVLVSLETQVPSQVILDRGYLPDCFSVSYDYGVRLVEIQMFCIFRLAFLRFTLASLDSR